MKKIFPVFLVALMAISFSCKKDSNKNGGSGDYYIKAKFDGQLKEFSSATAVKAGLAPNIFSLVIGGITSSEQFNIALWSGADDFQAGKTFTIDAPEVSSYNVLAYVTPTGSADPMNQWTSVYAYAPVSQSLSVTITEATSSYIKGTFSGIIYQDNDASANSKTVTEGVFSAKF